MWRIRSTICLASKSQLLPAVMASLLVFASEAHAGDTNVAVAANFTQPAKVVALSEIIARQGGSRWVVPANLYSAIRQDAALLRSGADNDAAKAFLAFMKGPEAAKVIEKYGYGMP